MEEIVRVTKKDFYEALLDALKDREDYELCAKMRDVIKDIKDPNEVIELEIKR